ncbi:MAG: hypothetical protein KDA21_08350 [Phycisphaerales bacterium]|nr:hypothetical protein [Phycisphaerales bacterium]
MSAALFGAALITFINAPGGGLTQRAEAAGPVPFDAAGQRSAMLEELRGIKELLTKAETRATKAEKDRDEFEERMTREADERHRELIRLLQSGKIKVDSVMSGSGVAAPN